MSAADPPQGLTLGRRLRARRAELGLTMQAVATEAGLSVGFISQVERGLTAPSLSSLVSISRVLGEPVSRFLDQPENTDQLTRRASREVYSIVHDDLAYERLSSSFPGSLLRSVIMHEPPGHRSIAISHQGEEMMYVLRGELTVEVDGKRTVMGEGDSIHFASTLTHSTWNHTDQPTTVLWCGTMDVFGETGADPIRHRKVTPSENQHEQQERRHRHETGTDLGPSGRHNADRRRTDGHGGRNTSP